MPDITDARRRLPAAARGKALIEAAQTDITNRWTGRSWSEVMGSVWRNKTWVAGQGLKVTINMVSGGTIGSYAEQGLDCIGKPYAKEALSQVWALIEDDIKGRAEELVRATPGAISGSIESFRARVSGTAAPVAELDIEESASTIKNKMAELVLRAGNVRAAAENGRWQYCDDIHWAYRELAHAEACRQTIVDEVDKMIAFLTAMRQQAESTLPNAAQDKAAFERAAAEVVADTSTVRHKMHDNFGVMGAMMSPVSAFSSITGSCSKEHCFGPGR